MTEPGSPDAVRPFPRSAIALSWAGVLPFAFLAAVAWRPEWRVPALQAFLAYSVVILSFLGGVRWGRAMAAGASTRQFAGAVLPSLWGWLAWLALPPGPAVLALACAFAAVAWWDVQWDSLDAPAAFRDMRRRVSLAVVACHALALAAAWTAWS